MISEIVEVLTRLFESVKKASSLEDFEKLTLFNKRYKKNIIATAYSWLHEKITRDSFLNNTERIESSRSIRVLSEPEIQIIGLDNYNYLLHLYNVGLLNSVDFEIIVDEICMFSPELISTELINILVLSLFLELDSYTLPGSRLQLHSSDKIN